MYVYVPHTPLGGLHIILNNNDNNNNNNIPPQSPHGGRWGKTSIGALYIVICISSEEPAFYQPHSLATK